MALGGGGEGVGGDEVEAAGVREACWREEEGRWWVRRRVWCMSFRVDISRW